MKEEQENKLAEIYFVKDQFSYMKSFVESLLEEQKKELMEEVVESFHRMQERYPEFVLDLELFEGDILINTTNYKRTKLNRHD